MSTMLLATVVVLLVLVLVTLFAVLRQQGRMLLRLDQFGSRLGQLGSHPEMVPVAADAAELAVGARFAPFELPDVTGKLVASDAFREKRLLVVHWDPSCTFCDLISADLAAMEGPLRSRGVQLLLLSRGDADGNRRLAAEHQLECPILLQDEARLVPEFRGAPTPMAYLLDETGRVLRPAAVGAQQVPALAREASEPDAGGPSRLRGQRPLSESRIERNGLPPGTPAPSFQLPALTGGTIALDDYRGRHVLLVFSDPGCGPCDQLTSELVRWHTTHQDDSMATLLISRGDLEENRQKAAQHGVTFPVVLQDRWSLSKEYGIFATPVAFLIDEEGVVCREVARGVDEILGLAGSGFSDLRGASTC